MLGLYLKSTMCVITCVVSVEAIAAGLVEACRGGTFCGFVELEAVDSLCCFSAEALRGPVKVDEMSAARFLVRGATRDSSSERLQKHENCLRRKERWRRCDGPIFGEFCRAHSALTRGFNRRKSACVSAFVITHDGHSGRFNSLCIPRPAAIFRDGLAALL